MTVRTSMLSGQLRKIHAVLKLVAENRDFRAKMDSEPVGALSEFGVTLTPSELTSVLNLMGCDVKSQLLAEAENTYPEWIADMRKDFQAAFAA